MDIQRLDIDGVKRLIGGEPETGRWSEHNEVWRGYWGLDAEELPPILHEDWVLYDSWSAEPHRMVWVWREFVRAPAIFTYCEGDLMLSTHWPGSRSYSKEYGYCELFYRRAYYEKGGTDVDAAIQAVLAR
jgi:hypothetical protein